MKTVEQLKQEQAAELAKLEREHALAALCPVPPKRVQITTASLGHWIIYEAPTLWAALDIMASYEPIPFYAFKGTFLRFVPESLNVGRDKGESDGVPYVAQIRVSQGEGFGPTVDFKFFALVGADVCEIHCKLQDGFRNQFGQYAAPFAAMPNGHSRRLEGQRYINGEWRANGNLSGLFDKVTKWGTGSQESAEYSYAIVADSIDPMTWTDARLRLENVAQVMHGDKPESE